MDGPLTYGWVRAALEVTDRLSAIRVTIFPAISIPILIGCPGEEHFVDPEAEKRTATRLSMGTLVSYPTARHELFLERDDVRSAWFTAIEQFLDRTLAPRP